jgi:fructose-1,6-bisphosphatase/inositol monophosphatase family enzyme
VDDLEPVTQADRDANQLIVDRLERGSYDGISPRSRSIGATV